LTAQLNKEQTTVQTLKQEITMLGARAARHDAGPAADTTPANGPVKTHEEWLRDYGKLEARHNALKAELRKAIELLRAKKEKKDKWQEYAVWLEAQARKRGGSGKDRNGQRLETSAPDASTSPELVSKKADGKNTSACNQQAPTAVPSGIAEEPVRRSDATKTVPHAPNQAVELNPPNVKEEEPDSPVEISHRVVRKPTTNAVPPEERMRRIKAEILSSSPPSPRRIDSYETVEDLDNSLHLVTPRKKVGVDRINTTEPASPSRVNISEMVVNAGIESDPSPNVGISTPSEGARLPPTRPTIAMANISRTTPKPKASTVLTPHDGAQPLQEQDPNIQARPADTTVGAAPTKLKRSIRAVADDDMSGVSSDADAFESRPRKPDRLEQLLNTPKTTPGPQGASHSEPRPRTRHNPSATPLERSFPPAHPSSTRATASKKEVSPTKIDRPSKRRRTGGDTREKHTGPIRDKETSTLRLDDFKVNPKFNSGLTFAFSEVVRNREERAALPGCTDRNCCGKDFRAMALAERPLPPLTPAQRSAATKLLEDYLGATAYRIPHLDPEERDELWLEAKTRQLADRFGKHKHRFHRAASPPGFWNADFPTTQEIQEERRQAEQRERDLVMERYREAMRPGGRWLFRDE
jgi:hypothetical protein